MFFPFLTLLELYLTSQITAEPPFSVPFKREHQVARVVQPPKPLLSHLLLFRLKRSFAATDDEEFEDEDDDENDDYLNENIMAGERRQSNQEAANSQGKANSLSSLLLSAIQGYNELGSTYSSFFLNSASKHAVMDRMTRIKADKYMAKLVEQRQAELAKQSEGQVDQEWPSAVAPPPTDVAFSVSTRNLSEVILLLLSFVLLLVYTTAYWLFFRWKSDDEQQNDELRKRKLRLGDLLKGKNIVFIDEEKNVKRKRRKVGKRRKEK